MKFIFTAVFLILCSPSWAQHSSTNGYFFSTANVSKHTAASILACTASQNGVIRQVTDALAPTLGVLVAGGGAVTVFVVCNGTNWIVS